ncbi:MAG: GerMN domain-containing protein [Actinomycetota bacterium]
MRSIGVVASGVAMSVALCVTVTASCGIGTDDQPRALPITPTSTTPSTAAAPSGPVDAVLWYVENQKLIPATRAVEDRRLSTVLAALVDPSAKLEGNLSNAVPLGTELLGVEEDSGSISIDLSGGFDELAGTARQLALGQLVFTATQDREARQVRFLVDGKPVRASTPERGDVDETTVCDFASLLPSADESTETQFAAATVEQLTERLARVDAQCG